MSKRGGKAVSPSKSLGEVTPFALPRRSLRSRASTSDSVVGRLSGRASLLSDNTYIDAPGRQSWWKRLDRHSVDIKEVFDNRATDDENFNIENIVQTEPDPSSAQSNKPNLILDDLSDTSSTENQSIVIQNDKITLFGRRQTRKQTAFRVSLSHTAPDTTNTVFDNVHDAENEEHADKIGKKDLFKSSAQSNKQNLILDDLSDTSSTANQSIVIQNEKNSLFGRRQTRKQTAFKVSLSHTADTTKRVFDNEKNECADEIEKVDLLKSAAQSNKRNLILDDLSDTSSTANQSIVIQNEKNNLFGRRQTRKQTAFRVSLSHTADTTKRVFDNVHDAENEEHTDETGKEDLLKSAVQSNKPNFILDESDASSTENQSIIVQNEKITLFGRRQTKKQTAFRISLSHTAPDLMKTVFDNEHDAENEEHADEIEKKEENEQQNSETINEENNGEELHSDIENEQADKVENNDKIKEIEMRDEVAIEERNVIDYEKQDCVNENNEKQKSDKKSEKQTDGIEKEVQNYEENVNRMENEERSDESEDDKEYVGEQEINTDNEEHFEISKDKEQSDESEEEEEYVGEQEINTDNEEEHFEISKEKEQSDESEEEEEYVREQEIETDNEEKHFETSKDEEQISDIENEDQTDEIETDKNNYVENEQQNSITVNGENAGELQSDMENRQVKKVKNNEQNEEMRDEVVEEESEMDYEHLDKESEENTDGIQKEVQNYMENVEQSDESEKEKESDEEQEINTDNEETHFEIENDEELKSDVEDEENINETCDEIENEEQTSEMENDENQNYETEDDKVENGDAHDKEDTNMEQSKQLNEDSTHDASVNTIQKICEQETEQDNYDRSSILQDAKETSEDVDNVDRTEEYSKDASGQCQNKHKQSRPFEIDILRKENSNVEGAYLSKEIRSSFEDSGWNSHTTAFLQRKSSMYAKKSLRIVPDEVPEIGLSNKPVDDSFEDHEFTRPSLPKRTSHTSPHNFPVDSPTTKKTKITNFFNQIVDEHLQKRRKIEEKVINEIKKPVSDPNYEKSYFVPSSDLKNKKNAKQEETNKKIASKRNNEEFKLMLDGKEYKAPKLFKPPKASWITTHLYKFLKSKLQDRYGMETRNRSERFVQLLYEIYKHCVKRNTDVRPSVHTLQRKMALMGIVNTYREFYSFVRMFMPKEFRIKTIPDVTNGLPVNNLYSPIIEASVLH